MKNNKRTILLFALIISFFIFVGIIGFVGCGGSSGGSDGGETPWPSPIPTQGGALEYNTSYSWQVESCSNLGVVTIGPIWTFTTEPYQGSTVSSVIVDGTVDPEVAKQVALTHVMKEKCRSEVMKKFGMTLGAMDKNALGEMKILTEKGKGNNTLAYVFQLKPAGYVVVSSHYSLPPVLAYSYTSNFYWDESPRNILLNMLRRDISKRLMGLERGKIPKQVRLKNSSKWKEYLTGKFPAKKGEKSMWGPIFQFPTWSQEAPYNAKCPIDPKTGEKCVVGCVATSACQIMNYWQTPTAVTLTPADSYTTATRKIWIDAPSASFSGLNYNGGYPDDNAKAALSYAVGVLVRMDYTSDGSGASMTSSQEALSGRLGFPGATLEDMWYNFDSTNIIHDIQLGCPVILGIYSDPPLIGHALNIDGYDDANSAFHLNFGWGGKQDGWYSLPEGLPSPFSIVDSIIYNIVPSGVTPTPIPTSTATPIPSPTHTGAPAVPTNPYPEDGEENVWVNTTLFWSNCAGADYYNIYLWKTSEQKPYYPTASGLSKPQYTPGEWTPYASKLGNKSF